MKLHTRITLLVAVVVSGSGILASLMVGRIMRTTLQTGLEERGAAVVRTLAEHIAHNFRDGEVAPAREALRETVRGTRDVEYAMAIGPAQDVFAHSFEGELPGELAQLTPPIPNSGTSSPPQPHIERRDNMLDVSYPLTPTGGRLHLGLSEKHLISQVATIKYKILGLTLVSLLVGVGVAALVGYRIARPLTQLAGAMRVYGDGAFKAEDIPNPGGGPEIADLTHSFNNMIADRGRAETALRESEERLRGLLDHSPSVIFLKDTEGRYVLVNRRYEELFHITSEQLRGQTDHAVFPAPIAERFMANDRKTLSAGTPLMLDEEVPHDDGVHSYLSLKFPVRDANGVITGVCGVATDITDRRRAEEGLAEKTLMLDNILRSASDVAIATIDLDLRITYYNSTAEKLFGYSADEVIGRTAFEMHSRENVSRERLQRAIEVVRREGEYRFALRRQTEDGMRELESRVAGIFDPNGELVGYSLFSRDVTERKRAEEEKTRLFTAIEQAAEAIAITDAAGMILQVNPAFEHITGHERSEAVGSDLCLLRRDRAVEATRGVWAVLKRGEVWRGRLTSHRKDGTPYEEEATIAPVCNSAGEIINYVAVRRDVTNEVALEAQLRQAQKMEAVGQLAGGVAHDFNNILTAILGNVELSLDAVKSKLGSDDPVLHGLGQIERSAQRAAALTRQLLVFSRRDAAQPELLDLNRTLDEMERMLARLITEDVTLEIVCDPQIGRMHTDAGQIEQLIMNLVVNARDAMPSGGKLKLETAHVVLDEAYVSTHAGAHPGPHVLLTVSDNGSGMDRETRERIFEPFFTTKPAGQGTGLGLATVYAIVKRAGGHLLVQSAPGQGTTFWVYLPAVEPSLEERDARPETVAVPTGSETVLVCEDDETVRRLAVHLLRDAGYKVLSAADGAEAIRLSAGRDERIHLLVTDVIMPDMNGKKLSDSLTAAIPGLRTLFFSGYTADVIAHHGVLERGRGVSREAIQPRSALAPRARRAR